MSTLYLVSLFNDQISDVVHGAPAEPMPVTGSYVVRVPDDVVVRNPVDVADILTQKHASQLANNGFFTQTIYDDLLDATGLNTVASTKVSFGDKGTVSLFDNGILESTSSSFSWSVGVGPTQAVMTWEVFQYTDEDPILGVYRRSYTEVSTGSANSPITAELSFNGGSTWLSAIDKNIVTVPLADQGTNLVVRFTHGGSPAGRFFLGSWTVLF